LSKTSIKNVKKIIYLGFFDKVILDTGEVINEAGLETSKELTNKPQEVVK
jgi:hypothetical protein